MILYSLEQLSSIESFRKKFLSSAGAKRGSSAILLTEPKHGTNPASLGSLRFFYLSILVDKSAWLPGWLGHNIRVLLAWEVTVPRSGHLVLDLVQNLVASCLYKWLQKICVKSVKYLSITQLLTKLHF